MCHGDKKRQKGWQTSFLVIQPSKSNPLARPLTHLLPLSFSLSFTEHNAIAGSQPPLPPTSVNTLGADWKDERSGGGRCSNTRPAVPMNQRTSCPARYFGSRGSHSGLLTYSAMGLKKEQGHNCFFKTTTLVVLEQNEHIWE